MKTTTKSKAAIGLAGMLFSGITAAEIGPNYQRPVTEAPAGYKSPVVMREARPLENAPKGAWWEVFKDRRLNALIVDATQHNQDLKAAIARFDQSRAAARLARANFFPTLATGFTAENQRTSENMPSPFPLNGLMYEGPGYNLPLEFSWEIDLWGKLRRQSESAGAQLMGVAAAMHNVLLAEGALPIATQMTTTMMMRAIAMMATTTADTIERAIAMNHNKENGTNLPVTATLSPYAQAMTAI